LRAEDIIGAWTLVEYSIPMPDGTRLYPFGQDTQGVILYSPDGWMTGLMTKRGRPPFAADFFRGGTTEEKATAADGTIGYAARWRIADDGSVRHDIFVALYPNWEGVEMIRYGAFEGDQLVLTTPPMMRKEGITVGRIVWERPK